MHSRGAPRSNGGPPPGQPVTVGVIANPASGRDVRRRAARAGSDTPESKRNQIARAVVGAVAGGAERILVVREPFRISIGAVDLLRLDAEIEVLDVGARLEAADTTRAVEAMRARGCHALIVLGGDGTNRVVARAWREVPLVPISTGTNNVFPARVEPTTAGTAAGLVARGAVSLEEAGTRAKLIEVDVEGGPPDVALIDAVRLEGDHAGSLLPFHPQHLRELVLTCADPSAVGTSPIGGLLRPVTAAEDRGLLVRCGPPAGPGRDLLAPLSPGLYRSVRVNGYRELALGEELALEGPGVLAFDGDRECSLAHGQRATLRVTRSGPHVIDVARTLRVASERALFLDHPPLQDPFAHP